MNPIGLIITFVANLCFSSLGTLLALLVVLRTPSLAGAIYCSSAALLVFTVLGSGMHRRAGARVAAALECLERLVTEGSFRATKVRFRDRAPRFVGPFDRELFLLRRQVPAGQPPMSAWGAYTDPYHLSMVVAADDGKSTLSGLTEYLALHEIGHISTLGAAHGSWDRRGGKLVAADLVPVLCLASDWTVLVVLLAGSLLSVLLIPPSLAEIGADNFAVAQLIKTHGREHATTVVDVVLGIVERELRVEDKLSSDPKLETSVRNRAHARFGERIGQTVNLRLLSRLLHSDRPFDPEQLLKSPTTLMMTITARLLLAVGLPFLLLSHLHAPSALSTAVALALAFFVFLRAKRRQGEINTVRANLRFTLEGLPYETVDLSGLSKPAQPSD